MKRACLVGIALTLCAVARATAAADPPHVSIGQLAGNTLNAVVFVPHAAGMPGGGELARIMLQAYLGADGREVVRAWDPSRAAYTPTVERRWSLSGSTFCLDLPVAGHPVCADIHIWGPRIAGIGITPYAMLDGDLKPGNALGGGR